MSDADEGQAAIHRQIAAKLAELVPGDPALPPHPYLRRHLAEHAAQGHVLNDDHVPLALLAWESSAQVRRLLAAGGDKSEGSRWLQAWATLEPFTQGIGPVSRLSSLRLARYAAALPSQTREETTVAPSFTSIPITPLWSDRAVPTPAWTASSTEVTSLAVLNRHRSRTAAVAAGDNVGTLRILRFDGRLVHVPLSLHSGAITHLLPLDGGLLITAGADGRVVAVGEENGQLTHQVITHRKQTWVSSLTTYHPEGHPRLAVAAFSDRTLEAFDVGTFQPRILPIGQLTDSSTLLCSINTPDAGPQLLVSMDDTVYRFDGNSTVPHSRHSGRVRALLALPEPGHYAVGDENSTVSLCDLKVAGTVRSARHDAASAGGAPTPVISMQLVSLARGPALVSAAGDGTLRLWKLPNLLAVPGMLQAHTAPVNAMTYLPERGPGRLLSGGADRVVRSWTVDEATFGQEPKAWNRVTASAVSPTPPHLLALARASRIIIKDLATSTEITRLKGRRVTALAWPLVGRRRVLAAAVGSSIICIDPETNLQTSPEMAGHLLPIRALVAVPSADGDLLASAGSDGRVCVWQPSTGERLACFGDHEISVRCLATYQSNQHRLLASGGSDGNIRIWDADALQQHGSTIKCDQNIINDLAFVTPDDGDPLIAAAGQDGTLKLWNLRTHHTVRALSCSDGELSAVTSVRLPFGRTALAAAGRTSIHVWDTTTTERPLLQIVTGSPIVNLKTVQDPHQVASSILLASGEAGSMALRLHHRLL
ncbi:WD40 repeat domain-containing protein [Streptomyces sp. NPDC087428]|uniref:WD40 repeat domain-containing protein n=1 Tax=Streptomyces sp. NPDC087428 TaxID=3365788 RepID=UPI0038267539